MHGRPEILDAPPGTPDLRFNISHTDGLIACAVTIGREVGVDVEHIGRHLTHDVAGRFFAADEVTDLRGLPFEDQQRVFFDYWTLKEAYIKARGFGLALPLGEFRLQAEPAGSAGDRLRAVSRRRPVDVAIHAGLADVRSIASALPCGATAPTCRCAFVSSIP